MINNTLKISGLQTKNYKNGNCLTIQYSGKRLGWNILFFDYSVETTRCLYTGSMVCCVVRFLELVKENLGEA